MHNPAQTTAQKQTQSLTPHMVQMVRMLQMTGLELRDWLERQISENPILEWVESGTAMGDRPTQAIASPDGIPTWMEASPRDISTWEGASDDGIDRFHEHASENPLRADLLSQLHVLALPERLSAVAVYLIESMDDNGFLSESLEELTQRLPRLALELPTALEQVQRLEPAGVGARDALDSLRLQLIRKGEDPKAAALALTHLERLAAGKFQEASRLTGIPAASLKRLIQLIRTLEPRPTARFSSVQSHSVIPEFILTVDRSGWLLNDNRYALPEMRLNSAYVELLSSPETDTATRDYLRSHIQAAQSALNLLSGRSGTLRRVVECMLNHQPDFAVHGLERLQPLSQLDVAMETGLHPSTVSRAVNGKFIRTPHGTIALRRLFSRAVARTDASGEPGSLSADRVQQRLRRMIAEEPHQHPYSDADLAEQLAQEGISIARRTVFKYREQLGIPSSRFRRRIQSS